MRTRSFISVGVSLLLAAACGGSVFTPEDGEGGTSSQGGGNTFHGGTGNTAGGSTSQGGSGNTTNGGAANGGATTGGVTSTGGTTATGGKGNSTGGSTSGGKTSGSGGKGGATSTGGVTSTGGANTTGGAGTTGGASTGGTTGGKGGGGGASNAGATSTGGAGGKGGATSTGGAGGSTGGASTTGGVGGSSGAEGLCKSDSDCNIGSDCCTCFAVGPGEPTTRCKSLCIQSACAAAGIASDEVRCAAGRCVLARSCNPTTVACDAATPNCPAGQLPSVRNACWGPCLPVEECYDVASCAECTKVGLACATYETQLGPQYHCVSTPPACEKNATCACMSVCTGSFGCNMPDSTNLYCSCPNC